MTISIAISGQELSRLLKGWPQEASGSAPRRLAATIGSLVLDGRLAVGTRLPSERELAVRLQVCRATVTAAYTTLRERGFVESRPGAGTWTRQPRRPHRRIAPPVSSPGGTPDVLDLAITVTDPDPDVLAPAFLRATKDLVDHITPPAKSWAHGYSQSGVPELREAIAERYARRGLPTSPDQILVTVGAQGAIHLLASCLVGRGHVVVEQPTYPNSVDAFRALGGRLLAVPLGMDGWPMDHLVNVLEQVRPRLAYLIPEFQNPTGAVLPDQDRERLVEAAHRGDTLLVVDETLVDLRLDGTPGTPVAAFDRRDRVISVGSLSKVLWGGIRVGWIRASPSLVATLMLERSRIDLAGPIVEQLAGAHLLRQLDDLLPARLAELRLRRDTLLTALETYLPHWTTSCPAGGLSLWVDLGQRISTALADVAEAAGVRLAPGPRFGLDGTLERFLRIPFCLPPGQLGDAVRRLAVAERQVPPGAARAPGSGITRRPLSEAVPTR